MEGNDIIKLEDFDLDNISIDENPYKKILFYIISYKTLISAKLMRIRFDRLNRFIRVYKGARYLVWFEAEKYWFNLQQN